MKKHILGFAIFSFIFASFAVAFAIYYTPPIPKVDEVKTPAHVFESRSSCHKKEKKSENLTFEVLGSQYFADQQKVFTKIKVNWNGTGSAPDRIYAAVSLAASGESEMIYSNEVQNFEKPFAVENSKILTILTSNSGLKKFDASDNIYAYINVSDEFTNDAEAFSKNVQPMPVLFVHGENSNVTKRKIVK